MKKKRQLRDMLSVRNQHLLSNLVFSQIHHGLDYLSQRPKERQYKAATGLSTAEFNALYLLFAPLYEPKKPLPYSPDSFVLLTDKREALFFILHYLKAYPTLQNMGRRSNLGLKFKQLTDPQKELLGCRRGSVF